MLLQETGNTGLLDLSRVGSVFQRLCSQGVPAAAVQGILLPRLGFGFALGQKDFGKDILERALNGDSVSASKEDKIPFALDAPTWATGDLARKLDEQITDLKNEVDAQINVGNSQLDEAQDKIKREESKLNLCKAWPEGKLKSEEEVQDFVHKLHDFCTGGSGKGSTDEKDRELVMVFGVFRKLHPCWN